MLGDFEAGALRLAWMEEFGLGRKRLLDMLLAASFRSAGVRRGEFSPVSR